jgi:signal transduction histidine kinase
MWVWVQVAAYLGLCVGYALLLILAIQRRIERGRAQRALETALLLAMVWTAVLGLLALLAPGRWWAFVWHRTAQIGLVLLALLTAGFSDAFVERAGRRWFRLASVLALLLAAVIVDAWPFPWPPNLSAMLPVSLGSTQLAAALLVSAWGVSTGAAWWTGSRAMRQATGSKHRNRIRYLLTALLAFTVGDLLIFIGGVPDVYVGLAARLFGFSILTFAILRYDLPDLRRVGLTVLRVTIMAGLTAMLYLAFLLVGSLVAAGIGVSRGPAVTIPAVLLAMLVAAVVDVTLAPRLHRFFDRTVLGRSYDVQKALREYSSQVNLILDLERLADTTLDWLQDTMRIDRAAFLLLTYRGDGRVLLSVLRATQSPSSSAQAFSLNSRFIVHFRNIGRPLSQYDLDMLSWFQAMRIEEQQWLRELAVDLYVPVVIAGRPVALLALGPKADGQPYSEDDLETLSLLAGQTGTAVENARLLDDLRAVQADIHRLNSELAETNRQLMRLDQTKADFVAIASHELRTPLSQIFGYSDVLASLEGDELSDAQVAQQFITGISQGASRLKRVVDAMVDVSLIETGSLKMQLGMLSLHQVVESAVETVQSAARQRELSVKLNDLSGLPNIRADRTRLEQVFISVVGNAVKFTPDGGEIIISGQLDVSSSGGAYVVVLVSDQGIGIDPDQKTLIFEKFYRPENLLLHSTDDVRFKGAGPGLGLAIAKGIVEAHGGRIWAESPGRDEEDCPGSTFFVCLPVGGPVEEHRHAGSLP